MFKKTTQWFNETLKVYPDGTMQYQTPPAAEISEAVLKFLAMSDKEREEEIKKCVAANTYLDSDGNIRDGNGRKLHIFCSQESLSLQKEKLEKQLNEVNQYLEKWKK